MSIAPFSSSNYLDLLSAKINLLFRKEKNALIIFLFHAIVEKYSDLNHYYIIPNQVISQNDFILFIQHFLENNYIFISPNDILTGLSPQKKYCILTFDDGYKNSLLVVQFLKKFNIPATFYIPTNNIKNNKSYWWNVVYRERSKRGSSSKAISKETKALAQKKYEDIEAYLVEEFGGNILTPVSDFDSPLTNDQLLSLSKEDFITIGNHTADHSILTNYSSDEIKHQILEAQNYLNDLIGYYPSSISYPNGLYSSEVVKIANECGLYLGVGVKREKNYLPICNEEYMNLKRFSIKPVESIAYMPEIIKSDFILSKTVKSVIKLGN